MVELRPSTAEDIALLYGGSLGTSVYGITGTDDGKVMGMGAVFPSDGCMVMVCNLCPPVREGVFKYSRALLKAARQLQAFCAANHLPARAVVDPLQPRAVALLKHLGFHHVEKDVYEWKTPA